MEKQYQLQNNGQEVQQDDLNLLGKSALADDRLLSELFRLPPYDGVTVTKAILPHGSIADGTTTVAPNGASGSVIVSPYRAIVGSRTVVGTSPLDNYRDIRSAVFVGSSTLTAPVTIAANTDPGHNPRWDLVYAIVSPDVNGPFVTRYVKDPVSTVISSNPSVVQYLYTSVTHSIVAGTPAASPTFPAIPVDAGGNYYIPLAYVRVPYGFNGVSTVGLGDILQAAPIVPMSRTTGTASTTPASGNSIIGSTVLTLANTEAWGSSGTPPTAYIPPCVVGSESIWLALDLRNGGSSASWSHQDGTVIDGSRDWRYRTFHTIGQAGFDVAGSFPWMPTPSGKITPSSDNTGRLLECMGQSWFDDSGSFSGIGAGHATVAYLTSAGIVSGTTNAFNAGSVVAVYCDLSTGQLKLRATGFPECMVFLKIEASAPYKLA